MDEENTTTTLMDKQIAEALAEYAHEAWSGWMRYLFSKCTEQGGTLVIPPWAVARWTRQMNTAYADLPESEKASDRAEATKILAITGPACMEAIGRTLLRYDGKAGE